jgi:hypothetical protein
LPSKGTFTTSALSTLNTVFPTTAFPPPVDGPMPTFGYVRLSPVFIEILRVCATLELFIESVRMSTAIHYPKMPPLVLLLQLARTTSSSQDSNSSLDGTSQDYLIPQEYLIPQSLKSVFDLTVYLTPNQDLNRLKYTRCSSPASFCSQNQVELSLGWSSKTMNTVSSPAAHFQSASADS